MNRTIIVLGIVSTLAWAGASAGDPEKPAPADKEKAKELAATVVITNEVLQQLYGPAPERPAEAVLPEVDALIPQPDAMEAMDVEAGNVSPLWSRDSRSCKPASWQWPTRTWPDRS